MQPRGRVANERLQPIGIAQVFVNDRHGIERLEVGEHGRQQPVLVRNDPADVLAELVGRMVEVPDPDAVHPANLVAIAGPNPAPGCPEVVSRGGRFFRQAFLGEVVGEDHVGPVTDVQPAAKVDPCLAVSVSTSLSNAGGWTTTPLPITASTPSRRTPVGTR